MPDDLKLSIVLVAPPAGHAFCLQKGKGAKSERLDYVEVPEDESAAGTDSIAFELAVTLRQGKRKDMPDFGGPFVQGPPGERFVYVCVGRCSTIAEPHWSGRVKVRLGSIVWPLARQASSEGRVLEARYAASRPDGRPALASVPLLGDGWTLT